VNAATQQAFRGRGGRPLLVGAVALALLGALAVPERANLAAPVPPARWPVVEPADHKPYSQRVPGSKAAFELAAIPGGTYLMGGHPLEPGHRADESPRRLVRVRPFWMAMTETTWDLYSLFMRPGLQPGRARTPDDADALTCPSPPYIDHTFGYGAEGYPAIGISHHAAMEFCRWLSRQTGRAYRLPTEAEWEWACRAGSPAAFSFGRDARALGDYAWFDANSGEKPHPVGKKKPNAWGLYDMHGNAAEWCLDHYRHDSYARFPRAEVTLAPVLLPTAARFPHVLRGGSWADPAGRCRSAVRRGSEARWNRMDPQHPKGIWWLPEGDFVGFRVVRAVEEQPGLRGIRSKVTPKSE
jgi:formylglycine-generating enzyme required for sulfatase activity